MTTLFDRLGYNFTDTSDIVLSNTVTEQMNSMPTLLTTWQRDDIINDSVFGYFINPCANSCNIILSTANTLLNVVSLTTSVTPSINLMFKAIKTTLSNIVGHSEDGDTITWRANSKPSTLTSFRRHTNRISGVDDLISTKAEQTANLPHYRTASGIGKMIMLVTYKSDETTNAASALGSFTSILIANTVKDYANTLNTHYITIISGNDISNVSNLTISTVTAISDFANTMNTTFHERRVHDENFYNKSIQLLQEYTSVKSVVPTSSVETDLVNNYIGSDKLKYRLTQ